MADNPQATIRTAVENDYLSARPVSIAIGNPSSQTLQAKTGNVEQGLASARATIAKEETTYKKPAISDIFA